MNPPVFGIPSFGIPVFGILVFGIPAFGIPTFGIFVGFMHPLIRHPLDSSQENQAFQIPNSEKCSFGLVHVQFLPFSVVVCNVLSCFRSTSKAGLEEECFVLSPLKQGQAGSLSPIWETGGILFREYSFGEENSLSLTEFRGKLGEF